MIRRNLAGQLASLERELARRYPPPGAPLSILVKWTTGSLDGPGPVAWRSVRLASTSGGRLERVAGSRHEWETPPVVVGSHGP